MDIEEFSRLLHEARRTRDEELLETYHRSLPFGDAMFDRWERARRLGFGDDASVYDSALIFGDVHVGSHTWVGPGVMLDGSGAPLRIGSWCSLSAGLHVYTHDTVRWSLSGGQAERHQAPVSIGDRCHIGAQSIIRAGVTIGDQVVVGANSFVQRDVPTRCVVAGTPARPIGTVIDTDDGPQLEFAT